ncbi:hypothetical protein FGRMN_3238 [Fusarium graminum]|nr:hypothetical protein FGRMN_3238 [Fusarium graminum]
MTDFLASFGLGAQSPAVSNNSQCDSVEELQIQMRSVLDAKATPTRAEHVSITIELRATVRFQLAVLELENGALDNSNSPGPSLGGAQSAGMDGGQDGAQLSRVVFANDTLMNQPQDDPALQRSVAKHIISMISSTDGSTWIVREVSRGTQGWSFTYLCRDSYQHWRHQNSKNSTKTVVGEFSQREPDPVLHTRPAFDCRGSIIIAFNRNSRSITVKYDHTPLHKTVADLATHFKPPPRQLGPGAQRALEQQQQQQQKAKEKTPRKPRGEKRERKKRDSLKAQDENGNPRKRKKKNNGATQATDGPMIPPDYPGASGLDGPSNPSYTNGEHLSDDNGQQGFSDYPQGLMGESVSATANLTASQTGQPGSATFPVNVSAAEAARRRDAATTMLSNAGVDPTTLSADQFGIFSNQAPELQRESLNMLVKYGAERLRIVHPGNREGSAQESASSQSSQTTPTGPRTTKELVPQSSAQSTDAAGPQNADDTSKSKHRTKKMGKSRIACFPCKARKTKVSITIEIVHCCPANTKKCPRERPTCTECSNHGTACEYAPQKPRNRGKKAKKSEAIVVEDDEDDEDDEEEEGEEDEVEEEQHGDAEGEPDEEDREEGQDEQTTSQDYSYPQINNGNMATSTGTSTQDTHATQNNYYQPASGHVLPHPDPYSTNLQSLATAVSQRDNYSHTLPETQPIRHSPPPVPAPTGTIAPLETKRWTAFGSGSVAGGGASGSGSGKTRRSLPSEPPHQSGHNVSTTNPQPSDWAQSANMNMPATTVASVSPELPFNTRSSQRSRQKNQSLTNNPDHQATAVANAVVQQAQTQAQARQSPVAAAAAMMAQARKSPYQQVAVPRTTSRASQRNQSQTPVANQTRGYQPPPDMRHQHNTRSSAHDDTSNMPSGSGYNGYSRYSSSNTATNPQAAISTASATPTTMSTSYQTTSSTANQWSGSSNRNDRSYNSNPSYQTPNIYAQTVPPKPAPVSHQNFNMRNSNTQQQTRGSSGSYNQQPQQSYPSYSGSEHQSQQGQTSNQQQQQPGWYFQNSHNPSVHPGGQSSSYNYEPWSGV